MKTRSQRSSSYRIRTQSQPSSSPMGSESLWTVSLTTASAEPNRTRQALGPLPVISVMVPIVRGAYPLLERNNLEDPHVSEWIESKLETGFYDANILAVYG